RDPQRDPHVGARILPGIPGDAAGTGDVPRPERRPGILRDSGRRRSRRIQSPSGGSDCDPAGVRKSLEIGRNSRVTGNRLIDTCPDARFPDQIDGMRILAAALLCALSVLPVAAQVLYGSLTGNVADPAKAAVPRAQVQLINSSTGISLKTETDSQGVYRFSNI